MLINGSMLKQMKKYERVLHSAVNVMTRSHQPVNWAQISEYWFSYFAMLVITLIVLKLSDFRPKCIDSLTDPWNDPRKIIYIFFIQLNFICVLKLLFDSKWTPKIKGKMWLTRHRQAQNCCFLNNDFVIVAIFCDVSR